MDGDKLMEFFELFGLTYRHLSITDYTKNVSISCPFAPWKAEHDYVKDAHPSMSVKVDAYGPSLLKCWTCGTEMSFLSLLTAYSLQLGGKFNCLLDRVRQAEMECERLRPIDFGKREPEIVVMEEEMLDRFENSVPQYIINRDIKPWNCQRWELRYDTTGILIRGQKRLVFPVRELSGDLVGFTSRAIHDWQSPKYHNEGFTASKVWYGEHMLDTKLDFAVVVEGQIDVLWLYQNGVQNILGAFGSSIGDYKAKKLTRQFDRIYECFDDDAAGQKARRALYKALGDSILVVPIKLPPGKDPAELSVAEVHKLFYPALRPQYKEVDSEQIQC